MKINWNAFIAVMSLMSIFFNIENTSLYFNYEDNDNGMWIFNIIIFIIIMVISTVQAITV